MATRSTIQALNDIRLGGLKEASEKRDVNQLMSWHSKDATFTDAGKISSFCCSAGLHAYVTTSK